MFGTWVGPVCGRGTKRGSEVESARESGDEMLVADVGRREAASVGRTDGPADWPAAALARVADSRSDLLSGAAMVEENESRGFAKEGYEKGRQRVPCPLSSQGSCV